ncbi:hypothetical protein RYX45_14460 [Alkalihalophilus pseudofirmus]|uniref:Uncharacterized protein n=1 Tax=Alkalihalophilus pseudofirmus TaxID=79885 RepID=A0AAJ2NPY8_ALKPS|nr:hypothetical protein [Alkalihalophilus pseudofirmus]MDV2886389.1 hypothetical protein [Alkalihalophilus pseudofirmus]
MYRSEHNDFYFYPAGSDQLLVLKENEDPAYGFTGYLLYVDDNFLFGIQDGYIMPFEG